MKLTIGDPIPVVVPRDSYMVEIQTMCGDGDLYRDSTVGPFKRGEQEASLQSLLETLDRMEKKFPSGMCWSDDYNDVLGYHEWFHRVGTIDLLTGYYRAGHLIVRDGAEAHLEIMDLCKDHPAQWRGDITVDCESPEKLVGFKVFYYDEAGIKHAIQLDLS